MPRVVRVTTVTPKFSVETIQSSSSNGSSSGGSTSVLNSNNKKDHQQLSTNSKQNGELFLLFRHLKSRRICHGLNTKNGATRKKGVMIPQEFQGEPDYNNTLLLLTNLFKCLNGLSFISVEYSKTAVVRSLMMATWRRKFISHMQK